MIFDPFDRSVNVSGFVVAYGEPELAEAVAAEIGLGDLVELENGCLVAGEFDEEA